MPIDPSIAHRCARVGIHVPDAGGVKMWLRSSGGGITGSEMEVRILLLLLLLLLLQKRYR
eukprot:SAG11_NODE_5381_length_1577_cov_1.740866_1_plen_60_part_00